MNLSWESLNINSELKEVIKNQFGFEQMTVVQAASIPLFITNKDLTVEAVTGSGKTLAFVVPILQILLRKAKNEEIGFRDVGAIVVSPTRELAIQTHDVFKKFIDNINTFKFRSMLLIGGTNIYKDIKSFIADGSHIIVSTPGRLYDILEKCDTFSEKVRKCLEVFVLDEADQLLSMGFETTLNDIFSRLPKLRRTSLFSATQTKKLEELIRAGLRNPVKVEVKEKNSHYVGSKNLVQMPNRLKNHFIIFESCEDKIPFLVNFVQKHSTEKFLIFLSTCAQVNFFAKIIIKFLDNKKIPILKLHRKLKNQRQKIFQRFREADHCLLLSTDIMSRGVDIPHVDWVIHFDLPMTIQDYVHRCGRSAHQMNSYGNSLLLCLDHEEQFVEMAKKNGVSIQKFDQTENHLNLELKESYLNWMKSEAKRDINFYELSMQAYVSFIRCYKQYMDDWLFKQNDFVDVANAYGLLIIPNMPELKRVKKFYTPFKSSKDDEKIAKNFKFILYQKKNKNQSNNEDNATIKKPNFGFKRNLNTQKKIEERSKKLKGKAKKNFYDELEMDELEEDARMVKKLKRKKISTKDFDEYFGL